MCLHGVFFFSTLVSFFLVLLSFEFEFKVDLLKR